MREADAVSELWELCYEREGVAELPELIDAHISEREDYPFCYLVFSANPHPVTLADQLAAPSPIPERIYSCLACVINTLAIGADMGICHGSLDTDRIELYGDRVIIHGMGLAGDCRPEDDLAVARAMIKRADRTLLFRGRSRHGRSLALFALERLRYFSDLAQKRLRH
jgi:hypothetical protein